MQEERPIILLVEDEAIIAMATSRKLEGFGYSVLTAGSGEAALKTVHDDPTISLILMDIDLGQGKSGPTTAEEILKYKHVPIVFLTSHSEREMVEKVRNITRYGYILKNSGEFVLRSSIEMAFELFNANENSNKQMKALQETEANLARGEKVAKLGNWRIDLKTKVITGSRGAMEIYESDTESLDLDYIQNQVLPEYRDILDNALSDLITKHQPYNVEFKIRRPSNKKIIDIHSIAEFEEITDTVFGIIEDITEFNKLNETLRDSEEYKSIMLQSIGDAVIATDNDGCITLMNRTAEVLTGWNIDEAQGQSLVSIFQIINAETRKAVENPVKRVLQTGKIIGLANHTVLISRSGKEYQISDSAAPIKDLKGNIRGVILVFSDVTEKYNAVALLRESEEKYRLLYNAMEQGLALHEIITDKNKKPIDYIYLDVNDSYLALFNLKREQIIGKRIKDVMPEVEDYWIEIFGKVAQSGESSYYENYLATTKRYYSTYTYCPKKNHFAVLVTDITERKEKEQQLQESESKFRKLVEDMNIGVLLQGKKTEILLCNPKALELLGISEDQLLGRDSYHPEWNVIQEDGTDFSSSTQPVPEAIRLKKPVMNVTMGVYHPMKQDRIWLSVDAIPQLDVDGNISQVICTFIDISERKKSALEVSKLLQEKELILKESLHHLKNDMNNISSLLYLQADTLKDPTAISALNDSANRIESMKLLYEKLYRSSNFEALSIKEYLESLLEDILSHFPYRTNVKCNQEIDDMLLDANIIKYIGIIVNELITNIMKYAFPHNRIGTISITSKTTGSHLSLSIADDGIGLPIEVDFEHSTGFGLQLVHALTQQLRGRLRIERSQGTKIILEIDL